MNKPFFMRALALLLTVAIAVACGKDKTDSAANTGVSKQSWKAENWSLAAGQFLTYSFVAAGSWTAESDDTSWCKVTVASGSSGISVLKVSTERNTSDVSRTATVTVRITGYSAPARFKVIQNSKDGDYHEVNTWVYTYMRSSYLWNKAIDKVQIDYTQNYRTFLNSILLGVAAQKDDDGREVNYDDGHWKNGARQYFYSNISGQPLAASLSTRAGDSMTDTGLWSIRAVKLSNAEQTVYGFAIYGVVPGTSADDAGLKRGMYITSVNGLTVSQNNYMTLQETLYRGTSVQVVANDVEWDSAGKFMALHPRPEVVISASTYVDPAIYKAGIAEVSGKKVAYLLYMGFETEDDEALIAAFDGFKQAGATELILDLRSNGGGAVRSSTVLGTLIAGDACKDQVYCKLTYNADRTARGESGAYRIGSSKVPDGRGNYEPISTALGSALGLGRIFVLCTERTASASELVVNGLRGLDLEVNLIGTQTNGKNVGMEGYDNHEVQGISYTFMPITFYSENAKGFRDYSEGFVPDVEFDDTYYPGDFGTTKDPLYNRAARWISSGQKPSSAARPLTRAEAGMQLLDKGAERAVRHSSGSLVYLDK